MKKLLMMTGLFMVTTSMMAVDTKYFIGTGGEYGGLRSKTIATVSNKTISSDDNYSDIDLKVKAGVILNNAHRISVSHVKKGDSDVSSTTILANYDYLIPVPMNNVFRTYFGVHVGKADFKSESLPEIGLIDGSWLIYGIQSGIIYDITKHIEFELGVSYTRYNFNESVSGTYLGSNFEGNIHFEDTASVYSGLNYKF